MKRRNRNLIRISFPPVRAYKKAGKTRYLIDARSKKRGIDEQHWRTDKKEALDLATEIANKVLVGEPLTKQEMTTYAHYREQLKKFNVKIERVLAEKLARLEKNEDNEQNETMLVSTAVEAWETARLNNPNVRLRPSTEKEIQQTAKGIKEAWGNRLIATVKADDVEEYLKIRKSKKGSMAEAVTRRNWKVRIGGFFNWCWKVKKWTYGNPCATISFRINITEPEIVPLDEVKEMLKLVETDERYTNLVVELALGFFGGLRPEEIRRIKWSNIVTDGEKPHIMLSHEVTKVRQGRSPIINDTLLRYLKAYKDRPIFASNRNKLFTEVRTQLGYGFKGNAGKKWEADGIRHTFATMHLAKHQNAETLAVIMGNSSEVIKTHYKKPIAPSVADEYWEIKPIKVNVDVETSNVKDASSKGTEEPPKT